MNNFFKTVLASIIGAFVAFFVAGFFFWLILFAMVAGLSEPEQVSVKANSVLKVHLDYTVPERTNKNDFSNVQFFPFSVNYALGLNDVLKNIRRAKEDNNIKGIYLDMGITPNGWATVEEIREELISFKESGKFIVAYGEVFSQKSYYLASVADEIHLNPSGYMDFSGLSTEIMFLKNTLEKLDIQMQVVYAGKYKSATEPLRRTDMSEPNKEQTVAFLNDIYHHFKHNIAQSRNIAEDQLDTIANNLLVRTAEDAQTHQLITNVSYEDEVFASLRAKTGFEADEKINFISMRKYANAAEPEFHFGDKIAVVYADGDIVSGTGDNQTIASEDYAKAIRKARLDDEVKAVVLRVSSPGGSALASDIIWREMLLTKKEKPVIVSMGNYAASGGYYISCVADTIVAQPTTITGSIGVFAILPNMGGFFNNKLGVTFDGVKTSKFADLPSVTRPMTEEERVIFQGEVNRIYDDFLNRVADGRHRTKAEIDSIGQGRVWTGNQAIEKGLVDLLGNTTTAIDIAAKKAGLEEYKILELPEQKDPFEELMEEITGESSSRAHTEAMQKELGPFFPMYQQLRTIVTMQGVQARLPFLVEIY